MELVYLIFGLDINIISLIYHIEINTNLGNWFVTFIPFVKLFGFKSVIYVMVSVKVFTQLETLGSYNIYEICEILTVYLENTYN